MYEQTQELQPSKIQRLKRYIVECKRVVTVTKKPTNFEFKSIVKVSGLGIILIGAIGFLVHLIEMLLI